MGAHLSSTPSQSGGCRPASRSVGPAVALLLSLAPTLLGARASSGAASIRGDGVVDFLRPDGSLAVTIQVEIAETEEARRLGLMGRRPGPAEGMLFLHPDPIPLAFWMRNTPAPLDLLFVAADGTVVQIVERMHPLSDRVYRSREPVPVAVEVPAGFSERHGIVEGWRIRWRRR